ncbi:MAG TPA: tetratricopeptide repeat protein [Pseudolabrys sp.]|nr:tetratricopeptide repeat protein [Pseudolabrys sp.]
MANISFAAHEAAENSATRTRPLHALTADAWFGEGRRLVDAGNRHDALACFDRALTLRPDFLDALLHRAISLHELNGPQTALADYERILAQRADLIEALYLRAICHADLGRFDEAVQGYDRVLAARPDFVEALIKRADALCELARHDEAIAGYDRALALQADHYEARFNRGLALQAVNRRGVALPPLADRDETLPRYAGFYVNLDRSTERRTRVEGEIARHAPAQCYQRVAAVDGATFNLPSERLRHGEVGCFLSHLFLLQKKLDSDCHLHIVEDDVVLSRFTVPAIGSLIGSGALEHFDIVFTDTVAQPSSRDFARYKALYDRCIARDAGGGIVRVQPAFVDYFASTMSFVVNRRSIAKVADVLARSLSQGATLPIDLALRGAAIDGGLRLGSLFPFVTSFRLDELVGNTIARPDRDLLSRLLLQLARHSFFVDCDHRATLESARTLLAGAGMDAPAAAADANDPHRQLLDLVLAFRNSAQFVRH